MAKRASPRERNVRVTAGKTPRKKTTHTKAKKRAARRSAKSIGCSVSTRLPKASSKAELIVREGFVIDATGRSQQAIPEVSILGNREGFTYLSEVFAHLAERAAARHTSPQPAEPLHLSRLEHPVNVRLSDAIEFRFAPLTAANRAAMFKRHGITMKSRERGSLFGRYREVADTQYQKVARRIRDDSRQSTH